MRKITVLFLSALLSALLCGCALGDQLVTLPYAFSSSTAVSRAIPPENPAEAGINPLTGETWSGRYHPIMVQTDADPNALPHWGVSSADIIYELPLHSMGNTRQVALYMSEIPSIAGPVRSARVPMASLREMWGAAWVFCGIQSDWRMENTLIDVHDFTSYFHPDCKQSGRWIFPFMDGTDAQYVDLFARQRDKMHVAPHNLSIDLYGVASLYNYEPMMHPFKFTDEPRTNGTEVSGITITYREKSPAFVSSYVYDRGSGKYLRYREGMPYVDGLNDEPCEFANVIVVYTDVSWYNGNNSRPVIRLLGEGTADIFQNGRWIRGSWIRGAVRGQQDMMDPAAQQSRMVFVDEFGHEVEMQRGKTFIQVVDEHHLDVAVMTSEDIPGGNPQPTPKPTKTPRPTRTPTPTRTPRPTRPPMRNVPEGTATYVQITGEIAKLRDKPSTKGILLGYAYQGETFTFVGRPERKWLCIELPDGSQAYVSEGLSKVVGE
ncbi:MAG: DUF3048 domain-containing protein [Clostridia bacterium]|nr:DUF3048 domain-containing protein [Clostridia bacterium]